MREIVSLFCSTKIRDNPTILSYLILSARLDMCVWWPRSHAARCRAMLSAASSAVAK